MYQNSLSSLYTSFLKKHNYNEKQALDDFTTLCETMALAPYRFITEMREFSDAKWAERN